MANLPVLAMSCRRVGSRRRGKSLHSRTVWFSGKKPTNPADSTVQRPQPGGLRPRRAPRAPTNLAPFPNWPGDKGLGVRMKRGSVQLCGMLTYAKLPYPQGGSNAAAAGTKGLLTERGLSTSLRTTEKRRFAGAKRSRLHQDDGKRGDDESG